MSKKTRVTKAYKTKKTKRNWYKNLIVLCIWALVMLAFAAAYIASDLPDLEGFAAQQHKPVITILDAEHNLLARYGDIHSRTLTYRQIPSVLIEAVLAAEDHRFFDHFGIDLIGILRAYWQNMRAGRLVQGGSTITQQLAKIVYLTPERTLLRKIKEVMIALQLERKFSKEQILSLYLNRVYLGKGIYGVDAAAQLYFAKSIDEISVFEAAILAGMLKAPSRYSPANNPILAVERAKVVLKQMVARGYLTHHAMIEARPPNFSHAASMRGVLKEAYFADFILAELADWLPGIQQNINVVTTLNLKQQRKLERSLQQNVLFNKQGVEQGAGLSIDKNGAILAMMGGVNYQKSSFNRAVYAKRHAGSIFKYYVYAAAMEAGYSPADVFIDKPLSISQGKGLPLWKPQNIDRQYRGEMTLVDAFAKSINTIAVQLSEAVGRSNVIALARDMGVQARIDNYPSLALGAVDITLWELVQSFAVMVRDGHFVKPYAILSVVLADGTVLYKKESTQYIKVLPDTAIQHMRYLLNEVVEHGTGRIAKLEHEIVFGKTGTSQDYKDAWFVGATDNIVTGIWVGNDDNKPMHKVVGGTLPGKIWHDYMLP